MIIMGRSDNRTQGSRLLFKVALRRRKGMREPIHFYHPIHKAAIMRNPYRISWLQLCVTAAGIISTVFLDQASPWTVLFLTDRYIVAVPFAGMEET
jgi:hypothetical protein